MYFLCFTIEHFRQDARNKHCQNDTSAETSLDYVN
jgi:hypothetical protein